MTVAQGAGLAGVPFLLSSVTKLGLEAVGAAATGPKVYQLYVRGDGPWVDEQVRRARGAGYDAFCLTVDSALYSRRERDIANRFAKPWRADVEGMQFQAALSWDDVRRFRDKHDIPLILKGIGTGEDADLACRARRRGGLCLQPWRPPVGPRRRLGGRAARRWCPPWPGGRRFSWMAASTAAPTSSRPSPSGRTRWASAASIATAWRRLGRTASGA
ncbi:MAG: alpha-hydroxy-acid oxidizing protein [Acetobacteraceae bacterium]